MTGRRLVLAAGVGVAALAFRAFVVPELQRRSIDPGVFGVSAPRLPDSPFAWCEIGHDNRIRLFIPKVELGQGVHTALAQVFADELGLDWAQIDVRQGGTERGFALGVIGSGGSTSVSSLYLPVKEVGVAIREALRAEAASRLGVSPDEVSVDEGMCFATTDADRRFTYGDLFAQAQRSWDGPTDRTRSAVPTRPTFVGRPMPRVDLPAKVTGRAVFGSDVRRPGMLFGAVARPPRYGAKLRQVAGAERARAMPGVVAVVRERGFVGVVANRRRQAAEALAALGLAWHGGIEIDAAEVERTVTAPAAEGTIRRGGLVETAGRAKRTLDGAGGRAHRAEYRTSMVLPLPLEQPVAVADVRRDRVVLHTPTQVPLIKALQVAFALRCHPKRVEVAVVPYVGGSFGRKVADPPVVEAARLSRAVRRPVQVAWTMEEELRFSRRRSPTHHVLRATLDGSGRIGAFEHRLAGAGSMRTVPLAGAVVDLTRMDVADVGGATIPYLAIPNRSVVYHYTPLPGPLPIGGFRSYGLPVNVFAAESFMDELARAAGADPLAFRLRHLEADPVGRRLGAVLRAAGEAADWSEPAPAGRARGVAAGRPLSLAGAGPNGATLVATVAEVGMEGDRIRVHRLTCAVDAGLIVNPDGARAQVEGAALMALSWALLEDVWVEGGMASSLRDYPILRLADAPAIDVRFVNGQTGEPSGLGEPPTAPIAAAVANAIFALTGERQCSLPLRMTS